MKQKKNIGIANLLAEVAKVSVKASANTTCLFCLHQPKQPKNINRFVKKHF